MKTHKYTDYREQLIAFCDWSITEGKDPSPFNYIMWKHAHGIILRDAINSLYRTAVRRSCQVVRYIASKN